MRWDTSQIRTREFLPYIGHLFTRCIVYEVSKKCISGSNFITTEVQSRRDNLSMRMRNVRYIEEYKYNTKHAVERGLVTPAN